MYPRRHHQRQSGFALYLLAAQLLQVGLDRIPPVTLFSLLGQVAIFLRLVPLKRGWPPIRDVCISTDAILNGHDFKRLALAPFFHLNDWHLYYNMVSFLWKGIHLERRMGSAYFAYLIAVFAVLTSGVTVGLGMAASEAMSSPYYLHQCAAGFSGVLFALKVLTTYDSPATQLVMGVIPVPGRYICWAELLLIQVITPNVSFIGHLAGIIVGLLYVKGPLKTAMDSVVPSQPSYTYRSGTTTGPSRTHTSYTGTSPGTFPPSGSGYRPSYTYQSGATGTSLPSQRPGAPGAGGGPRGGGSSYMYTGGLSEEEQMRRAMEESLKTNHAQGRPAPSAPQFPPNEPPPSYEDVTGRRNHLYPDLPDEELSPNERARRRRPDKFS